LPAVTVPGSRNGVLSFASPSSVVSGRGCSSTSTFTGTLPAIYGQPGQIALVPEHNHPVVLCGEGFLALEEISNSEGIDMTPELRRWGHRRFAVTSS